MMDANFEYLLTGGAIILGLMFGVFVQRSRFCMTAAITNKSYAHNIYYVKYKIWG